MQIIARGRRTGKTCELIKLSSVYNAPIITFSSTQVEIIKSKAKHMGLKIPDPIYVGELFKFRGKIIDKVIIDDADKVLDYIMNSLLSAEVLAVSINTDQ